MSLKATRDSLSKYAADNLSFPLAYQNKVFEPRGLSIWGALYLLPTTSESLGKGAISSDDDRGIFQISVFTRENQYDNALLDAVDEIKALYFNGVIIDNVNILDVTVGNADTSNGYHSRAISINYSTYTTRK